MKKWNNLTATWFFSEKQKAKIVEKMAIEGKIYRPNFINGIEFTEFNPAQDEPQVSNFDDAIVVHQRHDLPLNEFMYKNTGKKFAKHD